MVPHPWVCVCVCGAGGKLRCTADKGKKSVSEAAVTTSIYLQPPMSKTLSVSIQQHSAAQWCCLYPIAKRDTEKWKYLQWRSAQPQAWLTVLSTSNMKHFGGKKQPTELAFHTFFLPLCELAICCFVFSLWIRANKDNWNGWTPSVGSSLSSWILKLIYQPHTAGPVHSLMPPHTQPSAIFFF